MENSPEIPGTMPTFQELIEGAIDEEYTPFFVCNNEYAAGIVEMAASDSDNGRADLLHQLANEAVSNSTEEQKVEPFLSGGIAFIAGIHPDLLDVNLRQIGMNKTHWYVRLSRQDMIYFYTHDSIDIVQQAYQVGIRKYLYKG